MNQKKEVTPEVQPKDKQLPYELMDAEDEKQIIAEMQGEILKEYVYSFQDKGGQKVTGLSKIGIDQACREASKKGEVYRILEATTTEDDRSITVVAKAGHYSIKVDDAGVPHDVLLGTRMGSARQPKKMSLRSGGSRDDNFALQKCMSKAQRNALSALLPTPMIKELIQRYIGEGKVKAIESQPAINQNQIARLHAIAGEAGVSHEEITKQIKETWGYDSVKDILTKDYDAICKHFEHQKIKVPPIPQKVLEGFEHLGWPEAKRTASWRACVEKHGEDKAEKKMLDGINKKIDGGK